MDRSSKINSKNKDDARVNIAELIKKIKDWVKPIPKHLNGKCQCQFCCRE